MYLLQMPRRLKQRDIEKGTCKEKMRENWKKWRETTEWKGFPIFPFVAQHYSKTAFKIFGCMDS